MELQLDLNNFLTVDCDCTMRLDWVLYVSGKRSSKIQTFFQPLVTDEEKKTPHYKHDEALIHYKNN